MSTPSTPLPESTAPINARAASVLKWGFRISAVMLAIGIIDSLIRGNDIPTNATRLADLVPRLLDGDGGAIVTLSIVSMIATPVVATLVVALGFLDLGDRRYARLSFAVLTVLIVSVIAAFVRQ
ncbi:MAG: DUF1634 domain-containing protein [Thermomicrobiales bacterium]|nr:DUF1634 domain-containing protein [Thermomicrobiales bacterium]